MNSRRMIHRTFVCQMIDNTFVANSRDAVRVMGVLVAVDQISSRAGSNDTEMSDDLRVLYVDDGSALIGIRTPLRVVRNLTLNVGQTVDFVAKLHQRGTSRVWYAYAVTTVSDPHAEILRWMEVSKSPEENISLRYGYPTIEQNSLEALRLISVNAQLSEDGVSLEDLALVLHKSKHDMQEIIFELQLTGHIYQNTDGNYVPL